MRPRVWHVWHVMTPVVPEGLQAAVALAEGAPWSNSVSAGHERHRFCQERCRSLLRSDGARVPSRHGPPRGQLLAHAGEGLDVDGDRGEPNPDPDRVQDDGRQCEAQHVRRPAGIAQGRQRGERLLRDLGCGPGAVRGRPVEHPGQAELARGIQGVRRRPAACREGARRQASTTRPSSPANASGAESKRLPVPGTAPVSDRRCAADTTREGEASAPPWGNQPDPLAGEQLQEIMCPETRHEQSRGEDQQLGRTRQRERRGSTGRAGHSKAGKRLAIRFLIDGLLLCCSLGHCRHQPHRRGDMALI